MHTRIIIPLLIAILGAGPLFVAHLRDSVKQESKDLVLVLPKESINWKLMSDITVDLKPSYTGADQYEHKTYHSNVYGAVNVFGVFFKQQVQGAELINVENSFYDKNIWTKNNIDYHILNINGENIKFELIELISLAIGKKLLVCRIYLVANHFLNSKHKAKIYDIYNYFGQNYGAAELLFYQYVDVSDEISLAAIDAFIQENFINISVTNKTKSLGGDK